MTSQETARRWVEQTTTVRARSGMGDPMWSGRVIAYTDRPQVCIEMPSGRHVWWIADLVDEETT